MLPVQNSKVQKFKNYVLSQWKEIINIKEKVKLFIFFESLNLILVSFKTWI